MQTEEEILRRGIEHIAAVREAAKRESERIRKEREEEAESRREGR